MGWQFPGQGQILYLASSNPQEPVFPLTAEIPDTEYSMGIALNAAIKINLTVTYDTAPSAVTTIEYDSDPSFANAIILDTMPSGSDLVNVWTSNEALPGFLRINNTSGDLINLVQCNVLVSTYS